MKAHTKAEQREATKRKLIDIAREMFTTSGYAGAAMEDLVEQAGVTRGALYHHFGSKEGLFRAVLVEIQTEVGQRILQASERERDPWSQLVGGCRAFLEASLDPAIQRIMLVDAPAVLGWETWRQIDAEQSGQLLEDILMILKNRGLIKPLSTAALTRLLSGAMNEAALWIAQADHPKKALKEAVATLETLLGALRT